MTPLYNLGIFLYTSAMHLTALWNPKANKWLQGRKGLINRVENELDPTIPKIWIHCPSLGEFEQGRPLLEALRKSYPEYPMVLSFFSPSGYEVHKNYPHASAVFYLPSDTKENARRWVQAINPKLSIFVKYDFWLHYLQELKKHQSTTLLVSGIFRENQHFFGRFPQLGHQMLQGFDHFFVQNERSLKLLRESGFENATISGDTRFDRVDNLAKSAETVEEVKTFSGDDFTIVAGSTWPADEAFLYPLINQDDGKKWVLAPHEISSNHLENIESRINFPVVRFSKAIDVDLKDYKVLLVDNVGLLSRIYQYAQAAYVGGGFGKSIHNILEAATWGVPVLFGPQHEKFDEAGALIELGGAFEVNNSQDIETRISNWQKHPEQLKEAQSIARNYVAKKAGATEMISAWIDSKCVLSKSADKSMNQEKN